jgi:glycosyltransferase involved in cell wall biosynthesis
MNIAKTTDESLFPRVAFVSSLPFGGSTVFLCNLAGEMVRRGVSVMIVSPENENAFASDFQTAGVKVVLQSVPLIFEDRLRSVLRAIAQFRATAVVGCVGADAYEVLRYVPDGVRRIALIQTDHAALYDSVVPYAGCLDEIVGISEAITRRLEKMELFHGVTKRCLRHGVTIPQAYQPRGRSPVLRILYLGRIMNGQKRVHLFPSILANLERSGIPFRWTVAGEGDQRMDLEQLMASDEPGQEVIFIGPVPNATVSALLEQHDIFLLASDAEGLPISLLEAMGHGLVPVVTDLESGIREVVDSSNGILVPVNDVDGYAHGIIRLHHHRDELAAKSIAARERVKTEFSVEAMTDRWLAIFPKTFQEIDWPSHWNIKSPLFGRHPIYFSPLMRAFRRLVAKFR